MKNRINASLLTIVFGLLMVFWMIPSLHTAAPVAYTRLYEDTDSRAALVLTDTIGKSKARKAPKSKKYKAESISSKKRIKDVNPKMFSRAIQYMPHEELLVLSDSLGIESKILVENDSTTEVAAKKEQSDVVD